jgi:methionine synthase II (cobalamin-independent)
MPLTLAWGLTMITVKTFSTTEIGSLPHHNADAALAHSFKLSIPFLPQIPVRNPREFMIAQALEGLPGLRLEPGGYVSLNLDDWNSGTKAFAKKLQTAFADAEKNLHAFQEFLPSPMASSCFKPFLYELQERHTPLAKIQIAGPLTCQWVLRLTDGSPADLNPEVSSQIFSLVLARTMAMVRALQEINVKPIVFLDEPGLYGLTTQKARHMMGLQELKIVIQSLKRANANVGIHSCSETDWSALLESGVDVLSIDTDLSLKSLLTHQQALSRFFKQGGKLALGIVPTGRHPTHAQSTKAADLLKDLENTLIEGLKDKTLADQVLKSSIFTPACGLSLHSTEEAEQALDRLLELSELLQKKFKSSGDSK